MTRKYHRIGFTAAQRAELWDRWRKGTNRRPGDEFVTISHRVDKHNGVIEIYIDRPVPFGQQQEALAEIIADVRQHGISKWLFVFKTTEEQKSEQARRFTEFAFDELKKYISKIAVVCDAVLKDRAREVLEPIKNQEKPVEIFASEGDARSWLKK